MHDLSGFMRASETPVDAYGRFFVLPHDDPCVGAADEVTAVKGVEGFRGCLRHGRRSTTTDDWVEVLRPNIALMRANIGH
jgi:hypothetical protein